MPFIMPAQDQFKQLMSLPDDGPVIMVNLLKLKPDGGAEKYRKYMHASAPFAKGVGGRVVFQGACRMAVIGDDDWDEILVVEYPSIAAFIDMQRDKGYQAVVPLRTEALADSRLWAIAPE